MENFRIYLNSNENTTWHYACLIEHTFTKLNTTQVHVQQFRKAYAVLQTEDQILPT